MSETPEQKRERFGRIFPARVQKTVDQFRLLTNCSSSNYEWSQDVVQRTWLEMGKHFTQAAAAFGLDLVITVDGTNVLDIDTSKPRRKR
ncbi:MAG: hypothetical protein ACPGSE_00270 [Synechococcus sp.]